MMLKKLAAVMAGVVASVAFVTIPGHAGPNTGDAWVTNSSAVSTAGHATEPHLTCDTVYIHASDLVDTSGTFDIASIPGTGNNTLLTAFTGLAWSTPGSGDVIASFSGSALVTAAINQDGAVANPQQGFHFKLTVHQPTSLDKYKTFWVDCAAVPPVPTLGVTKTADASPVTAGSPIGFTIVVAPNAGSFADNVVLSDPLPLGDGLDWSVSPSYTGPGTCAITGTPPARQTLTCAIGDLSALPGIPSASVHVSSPTVAGVTAALSPATFTNIATAGADDLGPVTSTAHVLVNPAAPDLSIVKTADAASVAAGGQVGFAMTVTNTGPGIAEAATLTDPLPAFTGASWSISPAYTDPGSCSITGTSPDETLSCAFGDLNHGDSASVHVVATSPGASAVTLTNVATAQAGNNPPVTATATTTTILPPPPLPPDLTIMKTADAVTATAGSIVGFTIEVRNTGRGPASAATLSDPLPATGGGAWSISPSYSGQGTCTISGNVPSQTLSCGFGDLAPETLESVHIVATSSSDTAATLINVASTQAENNPVVTATATTTTIVPPTTPATPDLTITKVADAVTTTAGDPVGFTITVVNAGAGTAASATIADPLPSFTGASWSISPAYSGQGTCTLTGTAPTQSLSCALGDLAAGASVTVHVTTGTTAGLGLTVTNVATTQATNNDPVTATAVEGVNVPGTSVLGTTITRTPSPSSTTSPSPSPTTSPSPSPTPVTQVLGESITRQATGLLPFTGGVPIQLAWLGALLLLIGGALLGAARWRRQGGRHS
jgi:uncharacterized repeat protein (TIGR01451 family)